MGKMADGCCYGGEDNDKPVMKGKKGDGLSEKPMMKKGGTGGGKGKTGHELHHHNRPHGLKGPSSPEGY